MKNSPADTAADARAKVHVNIDDWRLSGEAARR